LVGQGSFGPAVTFPHLFGFVSLSVVFVSLSVVVVVVVVFYTGPSSFPSLFQILFGLIFVVVFFVLIFFFFFTLDLPFLCLVFVLDDFFHPLCYLFLFLVFVLVFSFVVVVFILSTFHLSTLYLYWMIYFPFGPFVSLSCICFRLIFVSVSLCWTSTHLSA